MTKLMCGACFKECDVRTQISPMQKELLWKILGYDAHARFICTQCTEFLNGIISYRVKVKEKHRLVRIKAQTMKVAKATLNSCEYCPYKTYSVLRLESHVERVHPISANNDTHGHGKELRVGQIEENLVSVTDDKHKEDSIDIDVEVIETEQETLEIFNSSWSPFSCRSSSESKIEIEEEAFEIADNKHVVIDKTGSSSETFVIKEKPNPGALECFDCSNQYMTPEDPFHNDEQHKDDQSEKVYEEPPKLKKMKPVEESDINVVICLICWKEMKESKMKQHKKWCHTELQKP